MLVGHKFASRMMPPSLALWSGLVSIAGILLSVYMVMDKYSTTGRSSCDLSERISCSAINNSSFSMLLGLPVAVWGVVWFLISAAFSFLLRRAETLGSVRIQPESCPPLPASAVWATALLAWCVAGVGFIFYLLGAELVLGAICPMCTLVHVVVAFLFYTSLRLYGRHAPHASEAPFAAFVLVVTSPQAIAALLRAMRLAIPWLAALAAAPLVIFFVISVATGLSPLSPEQAAFRTCLIEKGHQLVIYATAECAMCQSQVELLGPRVMQMVQHVNCSSGVSCKDKNLKGFPTWIVLDSSEEEIARFFGFRTLAQLMSLASCGVS